MILDTLDRAALYHGVHPGFEKAFAYLKNLKEFPAEGKYPIDGEKVFASVQVYETSPAEENLWEAHRNYIDIQYVFSGNETMGWAELSGFAPTAVYEADKDVILEKEITGGTLFDVAQRQFAVFFPSDIHKPRCIAPSGKEKILKIVVKVAV